MVQYWELVRKASWKYTARWWWWWVPQSWLTLCNSMECSPPGSSVKGILWARIVESVTIPISRGTSQPRGRTWVSWATREVSIHICQCIKLGSPEAQPETKIQVQVVYLGSDPQKHWLGNGKVRQGREGSHKRLLWNTFSLWKRQLSPVGDFWGLHQVPAERAQSEKGRRGWGVYLSVSDWEMLLHISSQTFSP